MPRTRSNPKFIHPIDAFIGKKIKEFRLLRERSQESLGTTIGVTFQQVQKYERGTNRITVSRLFDISRALNIPISSFLQGCEVYNKKGEKPESDSGAQFTNITFMSKEIVRLTCAYSKIKNPQLKKQLQDLANAMASA